MARTVSHDTARTMTIDVSGPPELVERAIAYWRQHVRHVRLSPGFAALSVVYRIDEPEVGP
jgi:hypothetical protein